MYFTDERKGTKVEEFIDYECPSFFQWFCDWELSTQRQKYLENLKKQMANL